MKRYAIVRVEHYCPIIEDNCGDLKETPYCPQDKDKNFLCSDCKMLKNYGDTKEQLIRKVAQVIFRNAPQETYHPRYIEQREKILKVATEIVEFLGVEE